MGSNTGRGGRVVKGKMPNAGNKLVIETEPWTNGDAIRDMTDEELADFINSVEAEAIKRAGRYLTKTEIERGKAQRLDWLRQEALP